MHWRALHAVTLLGFAQPVSRHGDQLGSTRRCYLFGSLSCRDLWLPFLVLSMGGLSPGLSMPLVMHRCFTRCVACPGCENGAANRLIAAPVGLPSGTASQIDVVSVNPLAVRRRKCRTTLPEDAISDGWRVLGCYRRGGYHDPFPSVAYCVGLVSVCPVHRVPNLVVAMVGESTVGTCIVVVFQYCFRSASHICTSVFSILCQSLARRPGSC